MWTADILRAAKQNVKRGWCQGRNAVDADGDEVYSGSPVACKWCAWGAMLAVDPALGPSCLPLEIFMRANRISSVIRWNDETGRTKKQVVAAFDRAIALAAKEC